VPRLALGLAMLGWWLTYFFAYRGLVGKR